MSKSILAVDDSKTIRETIRLILNTKGYEVDVASGGNEALVMLENNEYDLVFTDYNMPEMDGYALIKRIRDLPSSQRNVPVIVLTTESEYTKKLLSKNAGAQGWIVKPFTAEQLVSAIENAAK